VNVSSHWRRSRNACFNVRISLGTDSYTTVFEEHSHGHGATGRDNNMRAAIIHVMADAAVSVLVIVACSSLVPSVALDGPLAGIVGACVIASWSYGLIRDTGAILLDRIPDRRLAEDLRTTIESDGSKLRICICGAWAWSSRAIVSVCRRTLYADYTSEVGALSRAFAPHD